MATNAEMTLARARTENARLQERVEGTERVLKRAYEHFWMPYDEWHRWRDAVLSTKALAERRGEALKHGADVCAQAVAGLGADLSTLRSQGVNSTHIDRMMRHLEAIDGAREIYRAAIAATHEGEKEGE